MSEERILNKLKQKLGELYRESRDYESHDELKTALIEKGILRILGYEKIGKDIRIEKRVGDKRTDIICLDDYRNVVFVIEVKKPTETLDRDDFRQLWENYVKPLRARYGILTNGVRFILYERINGNYEIKLDVDLGNITYDDCRVIYECLRKPEIDITKVDRILDYFEKFKNVDERLNLRDDVAREHFFASFELKEDSVFTKLVEQTFSLFNSRYGKSHFLTSAYDFWKKYYARKPEKIPENWKRILDKLTDEITTETLYRFMFCLETAYALFTRIVLAKACEDYGFPHINFSEFIKNEVRRYSFRGDFPKVAWAVLLRNLVEEMKRELVESVFEEDIFYWWTDYFALSKDDLFSAGKVDTYMLSFSEAVGQILLTLYKFDFSEIVGDPLGTLYQRYFDRETRKALGEFYTPKEVVEYIIDAVGYKGKSIIEKRLLDPACGSGTFLVEALKRWLKEAEDLAEEKGWDFVLDKLCKEFHIVGFDIHPFATLMAQIQFMLILLPYYKKAIDVNKLFTLRRLPIFRTDSLEDETKTGKILLENPDTITMSLRLPIRRGEEKEFVKIEIDMPNTSVAISDRTGLLNIPEYFLALQAMFDCVKEAFSNGKDSISRDELERAFKRYLSDKDWTKLVNFFEPYAQKLIKVIKELKYKFRDGRLLKSIEDFVLASLLKNHVKYDFVVGNPPYVRVQNIPEEQRNLYRRLYECAIGKFDLYVIFIERGIKWLSPQGKLGYIVSNLFMTRDYGKKLREFILANTSILQLIDFGDTGVFVDVTNYPCIIILDKNRISAPVKCVTVLKGKENLISEIKSKITEKYYRNDYYEVFEVNPTLLSSDIWLLAPENVITVLNKISEHGTCLLAGLRETIFEGFITGANEVYFVTSKEINKFKLEKELLKPVPKGEDVRRWRIIWKDRWVIYPHKKKGDKVIAVDLDEYPNVKEYMLKHKSILRKRSYLIDAGRKWYEIWNPRDPTNFEQPKIITPNLSKNNNFAFDEEGKYYLDHDCYGIILKNKSKEHYLYVLALLNSKVLEFYLKRISPYASGKYYRYMTGYLEKLPIKLPETEDEKKIASKIVEIVDKILEKVKIEQRIITFPDGYIKEYREKGEEFDLVSITFKSAHKSISPKIERNLEGNEFIVKIGKEKPIIVDSEAKAKYIQIALSGKNVKKNDVIKILVPRGDDIVKEVLKKYEADKKELEDEPISKLEDEINQLVYKLYGLNEDDIKIIEDYLSRFS